jgi:hypothetical protein
MSNIRVPKLPFVIFSVYYYASNGKLVYTKDVAGWRQYEGVSRKLMEEQCTGHISRVHRDSRRVRMESN